MNPPDATSELHLRTLDSGVTGGGDGEGDIASLEGTPLGHYRILGSLGRGGFGTVWAAEDQRLGREVAIKLLTRRDGVDETGRTLLEAEARTVAALDHRGIVMVHALEEAEGRLFLVMEKVRGCRLSDALAAGPMPLGRVLDLGIQLAEAVACAHAAGIVHRDLNPRNVMVTAEDRLKVLDFGLALRQAARTVAGQVAASGDEGSRGVRGTVPYMAPEQLEGCVEDARTDLFALGVLLFEMASGQRPFRGSTLRELVTDILEGEPRWPSEFPPALHWVVARCLDKDPEHRFQHAAELARALERVREGSAGPTLAVMPFRDMGASHDDEHLCEGLAEDLLGILSRVAGLRVLPRSVSFPFKGSALPPERLCERLGAGSLLMGTLCRTGELLRLEVELVDGASGFPVWRGTFDRDLGGWGGLQGEIAAELAVALHLSPVPAVRTYLDPQAYEDYLRGRQFYFRFHRHAIRFALEMYRQAIEREPRFAAAWAGIATCAAWLYIYVERSEGHRRIAEEASAKALALDPERAEAHAARGVALSALEDAAGAEAAFQQALGLDGSLYEAAYFLARHRFAQGDLPGALEGFQLAIRLRPDDCQAHLLMAQIHGSLGDEASAAEARRRGLGLAEARLRQVPDDVRTRYLAANAMVALGQREKGLAWARLVRILDPDDPMLLYNLGCIHALAGGLDEALDCLEASVNAGLTQRGWFQHDGDLEPLRGLPRFRALVAGLGE